MEYEAPKLIEMGSVKDLTLGKWAPGPEKDNTLWYDSLGYLDLWGDPKGSR